jgi:hypothetical protein
MRITWTGTTSGGTITAKSMRATLTNVGTGVVAYGFTSTTFTSGVPLYATVTGLSPSTSYRLDVTGTATVGTNSPTTATPFAATYSTIASPTAAPAGTISASAVAGSYSTLSISAFVNQQQYGGDGVTHYTLSGTGLTTQTGTVAYPGSPYFGAQLTGTATGLTAGQSYTYTLSLYNNIRTASNPVVYTASATVNTLPVPDTAPSATISTTHTGTTVAISYTVTSPSGAQNGTTYYQVYDVATGTGSPLVDSSTTYGTNVTTTTYTVTGLTPSTSYRYAIRVKNLYNSGAWYTFITSPEYTTTTSPDTASTGSITASSYTYKSLFINYSITSAPNDQNGTTTYEIRRYGDDALMMGPLTTAYGVNASGTFNPTGLSSLTTYYYYLRVKNNYNSGAWNTYYLNGNPSITGYTTGAYPAVTQSISAVSGYQTNTQNRIAWTSNYSDSGYPYSSEYVTLSVYNNSSGTGTVYYTYSGSLATSAATITGLTVATEYFAISTASAVIDGSTRTASQTIYRFTTSGATKPTGSIAQWSTATANQITLSYSIAAPSGTANGTASWVLKNTTLNTNIASGTQNAGTSSGTQYATDTGLALGITYSYELTVSNSTGSNVYTTSVTSGAKPVISLSAAANSSYDSLTLTWGVQYQVSSGDGLSVVTITGTGATGKITNVTIPYYGTASNTLVTDSVLTAGQSYQYTMTATNNIGTTTVTTPYTQVPNLPAATTYPTASLTLDSGTTSDAIYIDYSITAPAGSNNGVTSWSVQNVTTGYTLYNSTTAIGTTDSGVLGQTGLPSSTSYTYRVTATNRMGTTSHDYTFSTLHSPTIDLTINTVPGYQTTSSNRITWTTNFNYATFTSKNINLAVYDNPSGTGYPYPTTYYSYSGSLTTSAATITGLSYATNYYVLATSSGYVGSTQYTTSQVVFKFATAVQATPTTVLVQYGSAQAGQIALHVEVDAPAGNANGTTYYTLSRPGSIVRSGTIAAGSSGYFGSLYLVDSGLTPNTSYTYTLSAYNDYGTTADKTLTITTAAPMKATVTTAYATRTSPTTAELTYGIRATDGSGDVTYTVTGTGYYHSGTVTDGTTSNITSDIANISPSSSPYTYTISATNLGGTLTQTFSTDTPLTAPSGTISADIGSTLNSAKISVFISGQAYDVDGLTYYSISGEGLTTATGTIGKKLSDPFGYYVTVYTSDTLTPSSTYTYTLTLTNNYSIVTKTYDYTAIGVPPTLAINAVLATSTSALITYSVSSVAKAGPTNWAIYRDGVDIIQSGTLPDGQTIVNATYTDTGLTPGTTYYYSLEATNRVYTTPTVELSPDVIVPASITSGFSGTVGSTSNATSVTGIQSADTDWMTGVTFNSGYTSGAFIGGAFTTLKPIYVTYVTDHFRSGGSGTVQLQMATIANPSNSDPSPAYRYYQRTSGSSTPITIDPDTDLSATFNPRNVNYDGVLTYTGVKWYVGFRQISGASVRLYRGAGDSGATITTDNTIYQDGTAVSAWAGTALYTDLQWKSVPSAPLNVTAIPDPSDPTAILVSWTGQPIADGGYAIAGYRILYALKDTTDFISTGSFGDANTYSYSVAGLDPDTEYDFYLAAINSASTLFNSDYSDPAAHTGTNSSKLTAKTNSGTVAVGPKVVLYTRDIASIEVASNKAIVTTTSAHGLSAQDIVYLEVDATLVGAVAAFDNLYYVQAVLSPTSFNVFLVSDNEGPLYPDPSLIDPAADIYARMIKWKAVTIKVRKNGAWVSSTKTELYDDTIPGWVNPAGP